MATPSPYHAHWQRIRQSVPLLLIREQNTVWLSIKLNCQPFLLSLEDLHMTGNTLTHCNAMIIPAWPFLKSRAYHSRM